MFNDSIQGNYIGTDATGLNPLPNTVAGVTVDTGSSSNLIGGMSAAARNIISGNGIPYDYGVIIAGPGTSGNVVEGNFVGVGADGLTAVPDYWGIVCSSGATNNTFGGTTPGARNIISGNLDEGLRLTDPGTTANVVQGNFIGTDSTGEKAVPNDFAGLTIYAGATSNLVGGPSAAARNVISGNSSYGVNIGNAGTSGNLIEGNYVGLDANGVSAIPNNDGVFFSDGATNNTLGGTVAGSANYVSGNSYRGVFFDGPGTSGNLVEGNYIGTDNTGNNAVRNYYDVEFQNDASGNFIGGVNAGAGNIIAFAGWDGVVLFQAGTTDNSIRGNSIFDNYSLGIDLTGVANDLQASPVITNAFGTGTSTVVQGNLSSTANTSFFIDVYRNLAGSQGQFYLGTVSVTTDGSGNASFACTNTSGNYAGQAITTTATAANGDTSEFSAAVTAGNVATASAQFGTAMSWQPSGFVFNLTFTTNFSYHIQATTNLSGSPVPWVNLTNFTATISSLTFTDRTVTNFRARFYRVTSP